MKFKRLIPALAMLLVSAILLGTSTFAWFSMNTSVSAESISITAKSNARYLLINQSGTAATGDDSLTLTSAYTVYPAKFSASAATLGTAPNTLSVSANGWYTANNRNSDNATDAVYNYRAVTEGDADYMGTDTMYLTLSADSEAWDKYVKITATQGTGSDAAASVVLKITNGSTTTYVDLGHGGVDYIDCSTTNLTKTACITVVAYTYIDGTSTNVYSDYTGAPASITGTIDLQFDLVESNS